LIELAGKCSGFRKSTNKTTRAQAGGSTQNAGLV